MGVFHLVGVNKCCNYYCCIVNQKISFLYFGVLKVTLSSQVSSTIQPSPSVFCLLMFLQFTLFEMMEELSFSEFHSHCQRACSLSC